MKTYRVIWTTELDAENEEQAAIESLEIQRDIGSTAVVFEVIDIKDTTSNPVFIDLDK